MVSHLVGPCRPVRSRVTRQVSFVGYSFFFQAEDGIRDTSVTGVQTCALPICFSSPSGMNDSPVLRRAAEYGTVVHARRAGKTDRRARDGGLAGVPALDQVRSDVRSEEHRVGKECRYRWT